MSTKFKLNAKINIALAFLITVIAGCNNSTGSDPDFNYDNIINQGDTASSKLQTIVPENKMQTTLSPAPAISVPNTVNNGLNPEHGKPGHRCDIPVGAPLNSKPVTTSQQIQPGAGTTKKTVTAPGMNPPHGEPGHRCDIAVGAPLNSKPVTNTSQQKPPVVTAKTITAPGMNPPHGEPGHRCDIAVGSPLGQPVKTNTTQSIQTVSPEVKDSTKN